MSKGVSAVERYHGTFKTLSSARKAFRRQGGWLLDLGGTYLVTDNPEAVIELRGTPHLFKCVIERCWDETQAR